MYNPPLVPEEFDVPLLLETERMRLCPMGVEDVVQDFCAVITSADRLRTVFDSSGTWPEGWTLEENLIELAWHQTEFKYRTSFAYAVTALDESEVYGSLYIYPTNKPEYDAEVTMWIRQSRVDEGLDSHLFATVENWVAERWPFKNPAYPGRRICFKEWRALTDNP